MPDFIKNLIGGVAIMVVATGAGLTYNAVREKPVRLITPVPTAKATQGQDETAGDPGAQPAGETDGTVTVERMREIFDSQESYIIDARSPEAFEEARIPGAINIPYDRLPDYFDQLLETVPMDAEVVCYCWSPTCDFSDQLARELRLMGYENVLIFTGGWEHWEEAGHPGEGTKVE